MELQITQEYTGQQRHLVYLAPMWKQVLDLTCAPTAVQHPSRRSSKAQFPAAAGRYVGVAGIGRDTLARLAPRARQSLRLRQARVGPRT